MRWDTFARSALFAALAAAGYLPWLVVAGAVVGGRTAFALYLVGLTAAYLAGLAPRRGLAPTALAAVLGCGLAAVAHTQAELVLGLGVILATARSAFLYRARPARALATEAALVGGGLLFARALVAASPLSVMLAVWGFFLVQGTFFLVGGSEPRASRGRRSDPFEEAHRRALALLERPGV